VRSRQSFPCYRTVAAAAFAAWVSAQAADEERPWFKCAQYIGSGQFAAAHQALKEQGIEFAGSLDAIWQANLGGGIRSRLRGRLSASWDLAAKLDTEKLRLWKGGSFFVHLEGSRGTGIDPRYVGSLFGVNGDADTTEGRMLQVSELWYEHTLGDGLLATRVGKMDSTNSFDNNAFANDECRQFLNGALVNNPTIPFPDYGLGAQAILRPGGGFYLAVGGWDAKAKGDEWGRRTVFGGHTEWFAAAEAGVQVELPAGREATLPGTYRVGAWHDPLRYEDLRTGRSERGASGYYLSLDQMVYRVSDKKDDPRGLGLFARYGHAPERYSPVEHFWSFGAQYQGLIPSRDDDVLGVGMGALGGPARRGSPYGNETAVEAYYSIALRKGVTLTLDLQYIRHPGATVDSSLVPGLRVHFEF